MLKNLTIGKRIALAFGLIGLVVLFTLGITLYSFRNFRLAMTEIRRQSTQMSLSRDTHTRALAAMTYMGAIANTGDVKYINSALSEREAYMNNLAKLNGLATTEETRKMIKRISGALDGAKDANTRVEDLARTGKSAEAVKVYIDDSLPHMTELDAAFEDLVNRRQSRFDGALQTTEAEIVHETWVMAAVGLAALVAVVFLWILITRSITRPVQQFMGVLGGVAQGDLTRESHVDSRDEIGQLGQSLNGAVHNLRTSLQEVGSASASVASGATELSSAAEQMAATTQEIAKSGEVLQGMTDSVAAATTEFMVSVEEVAANVRASVEKMEQAVRAAGDGASGSREAAERMNGIREATTRIASAVAVIQEIAQQTNLLSLNAAIEAAKAGEQGKGFAVVAEEVRKLAERSRQATVEIGKLIQETHGAVEEGVTAVEGTTSLMDKIHRAIGEVSSRVQEIGAATREQTATASDIAKRMDESAREVTQNATATQELSATVQEITRTAADLARVSETMALAVGRFRIA